MNGLSSIPSQFNDCVVPWFQQPWEDVSAGGGREQILTFLIGALDFSEDGKKEGDFGQRTGYDTLQWSFIHEPSSQTAGCVGDDISMCEWLLRMLEQGVSKFEEDSTNVALADTLDVPLVDKLLLQATQTLLLASPTNTNAGLYFVHWICALPSVDGQTEDQRVDRFDKAWSMTSRLITASRLKEGWTKKRVAEHLLGLDAEELEWPLLHAAYHSPKLMQSILQQCHEVGKEDGNEWELVHSILKTGFHGKMGATALSLVAWHAHIDSLRLLLDWMAKSGLKLELNKIEPHGWSVLHYLSTGVDSGNLDEGLERGQRVECLNALVSLLMDNSESDLKEDVTRLVPMPPSAMDVFGKTKMDSVAQASVVSLGTCTCANPELVASLLSLISRLDDKLLKRVLRPETGDSPEKLALATIETVKKRGGGRKREEGIRACLSLIQSVSHEMKQ